MKVFLILLLVAAFSGDVVADMPIETTLPNNLDKEIAMDLKDRTIYPIIKAGDWPGIQYGAVYSVLIGPEDDPEVVIGFGYDTPDNFVFLTHQDGQEIDLNVVVPQAFQNIDALDVTFVPSAVLSNQVLTASGESFSSEAILSQTQMLKAHDMLDAEQLLVSIARRTGLMVVSRDASHDLLDKFIYLHSEAWNDDSYGNAPIANRLFLIENGKIVGSMSLADK
ncbi:hypothetical protein [Pseudoalteromonas piscicida]|uniref:hypothetical protein n=1 Tax=Pseudoalteromonas piscicida TaxID=43662 RepID=UPI0027E4A1C1|nr:hypothetical protein [Pseudoalteromonas piscicida]WMO13160.1 hypothetical protein NI376_13950 [Pseudoalteromonas piscicida]